MRIEIDIQRTEATQLIQALDGKQHEKLEKCIHALLTMQTTGSGNSTKNILSSI